MSELLAHLFGDYCLQNHWMANTKTSRSSAALLHVALYILPFLFLTRSPGALLVIGVTHFVIDRFRLARHWVDFWGVGKSGMVLGWIMRQRGYELGEVIVKPDVVETRWVARETIDRTDTWGPGSANAEILRTSLPYIADAPPFLGAWLLIIADNTMHLTINHYALVLAG